MVEIGFINGDGLLLVITELRLGQDGAQEALGDEGRQVYVRCEEEYEGKLSAIRKRT